MTYQAASSVDAGCPGVGAVDPLWLWEAEESVTRHVVAEADHDERFGRFRGLRGCIEVVRALSRERALVKLHTLEAIAE